jgi:hypothetical protein
MSSGRAAHVPEQNGASAPSAATPPISFTDGRRGNLPKGN